MSRASENADSPRSAARTGEVRLTGAGETEVFDGVGWRPLASIYRDPQDGSRQSPDRSRQPPESDDDGSDDDEPYET